MTIVSLRAVIGSVAIFLLCTGCTTEFNPATQRQETLMYDVEKEKSIGASVALQVEKTMKFDTDVDVNERVERIFKRLTDVCDRRDLVYTVRVIDEEDVYNAFSLPGGYVYIYRSLIDKVVGNDDQLASVLAHEIAHVTAKHAMKRLQGSYGAMAITGLAIATGNGPLASGVNLAANSLLFQNSREDEFEADQIGVKYMRLAGFDPLQMRTMLSRLLDQQAKEAPRPFSYWRTHPYLPQRMAKADAVAKGRLDFRDYLNITGENP